MCLLLVVEHLGLGRCGDVNPFRCVLTSLADLRREWSTFADVGRSWLASHVSEMLGSL